MSHKHSGIPNKCFARSLLYTTVNFNFQALDLKPDDQHCLVTRSKCHLQVGNAEASLADAESALEQNKQLTKVCTCYSRGLS